MTADSAVQSKARQPATSRETWIDVAKGIAILLVVSTHAGLFSRAIGAESSAWNAINAALYTLRMPMFFCLSGLLAYSALGRSWRSLFEKKILLFVWLYLLWVVIRFAYFAVVPQVVNPDESSSIIRLIAQAVWSASDTWFLYALAVFFTFAKLMFRWAAWIPLVAAGLLSAASLSALIELPSTLWNGLLGYFFFFLLGVYGGRLIRTWAKKPSAMVVGLSITPAWIALTWLALANGAFDIFGVRFALSVVAVFAGIGVALALRKVTLLGNLGRNTLPIYLSHTLWIGGMAALLNLMPNTVLTSMGGWLPAVLIAGSVAVALFVHKAALSLGWNWLYAVPRWLGRAFRPQSERSSIRPRARA